jgi:hypothetical protein
MFPLPGCEGEKSTSGKNPVNFFPALYPVENDTGTGCDFTPFYYSGASW